MVDGRGRRQLEGSVRLVDLLHIRLNQTACYDTAEHPRSSALVVLRMGNLVVKMEGGRFTVGRSYGWRGHRSMVSATP